MNVLELESEEVCSHLVRIGLPNLDKLYKPFIDPKP